MKYKTGKVSNKDLRFIKENAGRLTTAEISEILKRPEDTIERKMRELGVATKTRDNLTASAENDIKNSPMWNQLKKKFNEEELEFFVYKWKEIMAQFNNEATATERGQVCDLITLSIQENRLSQTQRAQIETLGLNQKKVEELRLEWSEEDDPGEKKSLMEQIEMIEGYITYGLSAQKDIVKQIQDSIEKQKGIYASLKATRDQRLKQDDSNKETINQWIYKLLRNPEKMRAIGLEMEKMRLAKENVYEVLSQNHEYKPGHVDQVILTPENYKEDNDGTY